MSGKKEEMRKINNGRLSDKFSPSGITGMAGPMGRPDGTFLIFVNTHVRCRSQWLRNILVPRLP